MRKNETSAEKTYPVEALLCSKALSGYQPDFVRVLLTGSAYTVQEAQAVLDSYLKGGASDGGR